MNSIQTEAYHIKRLSADNIGDVAKLYTNVYEQKRVTDFLVKKYDTAYTEVNYVGFIAYNKQMMPISYYGVIPCFMWCDSKIVLAAYSADIMTHPKYRNRGLYVELAKRTYELCRREGIRLVVTFPNQNSLPGLIKLKCKVTERMDCFIIPVNSVPLEKISIKLPFMKKLYAAYTNFILKRYLMPQLGVYNSVLAEGYDGLFRDDNFFRYKTYSPKMVINVAGATVWIKINHGLMVGDILGIKNNFDEVMAKLLQLARMLGLQQIQFHTSKHTQLHKLFIERYNAIPSFPVVFKDIGAGIPTDKIKFTFADINIF